MRAKSTRGFTLLELIVSTAVVSLILAAVTSMVVTVTRQRRENVSNVDTRTNGRLALSLISFDLANAGFRFGSPAFGVRIYQNVPTTANTAGELADTVDCGVAGSGYEVMPGTDVLEIREGFGGNKIPARTDLGVTGCVGVCGVGLQGGGSFSNPFPNIGDGNGAVVIFSRGRVACAATLTTPIQNIGTGGVTMLKQDLRTAAGSVAYPFGGAFGCPGPSMSMAAVGTIWRYMVCRPTAATPPPAPGQPPNRPALFRQRYGGGGGWVTRATSGALVETDFVRVQDGVEDLQVAVMLDNRQSLISGPTCTALGTPGAHCWCNDNTSPTCPGYVPDATATGVLNADPMGPPSNQSAFLPRAYRVAITTLSDRPRGLGDQDINRRPQLLDHPAGFRDWSNAGSVPDGYVRSVYEELVIPQNLVMVQP